MRHLVCTGVVALSVLALACDDSTSGSGPKGGGTGGVARAPGCGNGVLDGVEPCDGTAFAQGASCSDYGLGAGAVSCTYACALDLGACAQTDYCTANALYGDGACDPCDLLGGAKDADCDTACGADATCANAYDALTGVYVCDHAQLADPDCGTCGDGTLDANELCDGTDFPTEADSCEEYGFRAGTPGCVDCQPTFATCEFCGDSRRNGAEQCDGTDFAGQTCQGLGYTRGRIGCTAACTYDTQGCLRDTVDTTAFADALCGYLDRCQTTQGKTIANKAECVAKYADSLACEDLTDFPDQATVTRCSTALASAPCGFDGLIFALFSCQAGAVVGEGAPCANAICEPGLFCDVQRTNTSVCASCSQAPGLGQVCDEVCDTDTWCNQGFCAARKANTAPCEWDEECLSDACLDGFCAPSGTEGPGAPCTSDDACRPFLGCNGGFCAERVAAGGGCDSDGDCYIYAECVDGTCTNAAACLPPGSGNVGSRCQGDLECAAGLFCDDFEESCQPILPPGGTCSYDEQCGPGSTCNWLEDICAPISGVGGPCSLAQDCIDGAYCDRESAQCAPKKLLGSACGGYGQCAEGVCNGGTCSFIPACQ